MILRSLKKLSEKRSYYSDTPGKFVLLKELKRKFLQIFFVDNFYFCSFVAENERFNQRLNQRKIIDRKSTRLNSSHRL